MSCDSPFVYTEFETTVTSCQNVGVSGSYTLPSYSTPSETVCVFVPPHCDWYWGGWRNWERKCSWKGPSWCCCWGTPSIQIWPSVTFSASANFVLEFVAGTSIALTVESPDTTVETTSIVIKSGTLLLSGDQFTAFLNIVPNQITITQENGSFSVSIELESFKTTYSADGFDYDFSFDTNLQFCLDPVPPVGWINLQLSCELGTEYLDTDYSTSFAIECPIVSVEEA
jgi:hypothetical protein